MFSPKFRVSLIDWASNQRRKKKEKKLSKAHQQLLDDIHFNWAIRPYKTPDQAWKDMYERLFAFHKQHGHSFVKKTDGDIQLNKWVFRQRSLKRKGKLLPYREELLNKLEFVWEPYEMEWLETF